MPTTAALRILAGFLPPEKPPDLLEELAESTISYYKERRACRRGASMTARIDAERRGDYTAHPFVVPEIRNGAIVTEPEFIRLPRPKGRCPLTGLSRTTLAELVDSGEVGAAKLRKKGSLRAITLIHRESLLSYLRSQMRVEGKPILATPTDIEGRKHRQRER